MANMQYVTSSADSNRILIDKDKIITLAPNGEGTLITFEGGSTLAVEEPMDQVADPTR